MGASPLCDAIGACARAEGRQRILFCVDHVQLTGKLRTFGDVTASGPRLRLRSGRNSVAPRIRGSTAGGGGSMVTTAAVACWPANEIGGCSVALGCAWSLCVGNRAPSWVQCIPGGPRRQGEGRYIFPAIT